MRILPLLCMVLTLCAASLRADGAPANPVTVFAAASLRGALEDAAEGYAGSLRVSYGGSGAMARQVAAGAPADLVILANTDWMDWLDTRGTAFTAGPVDLLQNRLALVAPISETWQIDPANIAAALAPDDRLAMGQRDAVPAGRYARQWLEATGQWSVLVDRLAETDDVRAALLLVSRRQVPLGVVYATDAAADPGVRMVHEVPSTLHDPIRYPAAALTPAGAAFLEHLAGETGMAAFAAHGFTRGTE